MEEEMIIKRSFDVILSLIALIILSPLLLIIAILIYFKLGKPIIFMQERIGKDKRVFKLIKFRTMRETKDKKGNYLPDEKRLTKFGLILRSTSIDELPELINVIKGDMSLVGPRPLLVEYLPFYNERQIKRHDVHPGLSGWAQINGRNAISWTEKFEFDLWYIENWSLFLDLKIILGTFVRVFKREGINQNDQRIMEKFNGLN
jgi:lipopolysaccharide/colanic/teichoic acid biosynthesis glycosyltransferase